MRQTRFKKQKCIPFNFKMEFTTSKVINHIIISGFAAWWNSFIITKYEWQEEDGTTIDISDLMEYIAGNVTLSDSSLFNTVNRHIERHLTALFEVTKDVKHMTDYNELEDLFDNVTTVTAESI